MVFTQPTSEFVVLDIYRQAIARRSADPGQASDIARSAFDATHPMKLPFELSREVDALRFEMGALEAPGYPPDEARISPEAYVDCLWGRLGTLVDVAAAHLTDADSGVA